MEKIIIQEKRVQLGLSRAALARNSGVPLRTLEDWEACRAFPSDAYLLLRVAKALGCEIEEIMQPEEQRNHFKRQKKTAS